jgi:hypothetical protein
MLRRIQRNMVFRLQTCLETGDGHVEQILWRSEWFPYDYRLFGHK